MDATCPYVMSAQKIVKSLSDDGYTVIILGDRQHPEVKSLVGFAQDKAIVIENVSDAANTRICSKKIVLVSQTTQSLENYLKVVSGITNKEFLEIRIFNTICNDTKKRQESAARLARESDAMVVIGGRMSANTKRLFEICAGICEFTHHVETADEIKPEWFEAKERVGIASGASTPDWIIESIRNRILSVKDSAQLGWIRGKSVND